MADETYRNVTPINETATIPLIRAFRIKGDKQSIGSVSPDTELADTTHAIDRTATVGMENMTYER